MSEEMSGKRAVAVGGGSGLPATIHALLNMGYATSAVVAMADNGGSTGHLRENIGIIPPGDIRNCLVAMAKDPESIWAQAIQYRFPPFADEPRGHALGNLMIAALAQVSDSFPESVKRMGELIGAQGRVYPSTLEDIQLKAIDRTGELREGQVNLSHSTAPIDRAWIEPKEAQGYAEALRVVEEADLIVFGPGSLYTSVIPNILVGGFSEALKRSSAITVFVCNVSNQQGESRGLDAADHVKALKDHGIGDRLDAVIVHEHCDTTALESIVEPIVVGEEERAQIEAGGVQVFRADVVNPCTPSWHSPEKLARVLEEVTRSCRLPRK